MSKRPAPWVFGAAMLFVVGLPATRASAGKARITPWLEYERDAPWIDIPHIFRSGDYRQVVRVRVQGKWIEAAEETRTSGFWEFDPVLIDQGRAVMIRRYAGTQIFREDVEDPVTIDQRTCSHPYVKPDGRSLLCIVIEKERANAPDYPVPPVRARIDTIDLTGELDGRTTVPIPPPLQAALRDSSSVIGWDDWGTPVVEGRQYPLRDDPAVTTCIAVALTPGGAREISRLQHRQGCPEKEEWRRLGAVVTAAAQEK